MAELEEELSALTRANDTLDGLVREKGAQFAKEMAAKDEALQAQRDVEAQLRQGASEQLRSHEAALGAANVRISEVEAEKLQALKRYRLEKEGEVTELKGQWKAREMEVEKRIRAFMDDRTALEAAKRKSEALLQARITELNDTIEQLTGNVLTLDRARKDQRVQLEQANEDRLRYNRAFDELQERVRTSADAASGRPSTLAVISASVVATFVVAAVSLLFALSGPK